MLNENVKRELSKVSNNEKNVLPVIDCGNVPLENTKLRINQRYVLLMIDCGNIPPEKAKVKIRERYVFWTNDSDRRQIDQVEASNEVDI